MGRLATHLHSRRRDIPRSLQSQSSRSSPFTSSPQSVSSSPSSSSSSPAASRYYHRHRSGSSQAFANVTNYYGMAATATATHHQYTSGTSSSGGSAREYYCQFCQRRFNKSYNLMIHERSHFEDSFVCDVCGKGGFRSRDLLRQHRSQHSPGGSSSSSSSSSSSLY